MLNDFRRAFISWPIIVGTIGIAIAVGFGSFEALLPLMQGGTPYGLMPGYTEMTIYDALSSDIVLMVLPVLCALPYTTAFVDDYKSRYLREYLPRAGRKKYIGGKVFATGLSGGTVSFGGILLALFVFMLILKPMEAVPDNAALEAGQETLVDVSGQMMFSQMISKAFVIFLCGYFWATVGALSATVTMSKYMAYASPFILYYILVILAERYFTELYILDPKEWIRQSVEWPGGSGGAILMLAELCTIVSLLYGILIGRRLRDA